MLHVGSVHDALRRPSGPLEQSKARPLAAPPPARPTRGAGLGDVSLGEPDPPGGSELLLRAREPDLPLPPEDLGALRGAGDPRRDRLGRYRLYEVPAPR